MVKNYRSNATSTCSTTRSMQETDNLQFELLVPGLPGTCEDVCAAALHSCSNDCLQSSNVEECLQDCNAQESQCLSCCEAGEPPCFDSEEPPVSEPIQEG